MPRTVAHKFVVEARDMTFLLDGRGARGPNPAHRQTRVVS
jgi:hypothetical protein